MSNTDARPGARHRDFAAILATLAGGEVDMDATEAMGEVIDRSLETGKAGTVTITVSVEPVPGAANGFTVTAKVTSRRPAVTRGGIFFLNPTTGRVTRDDPSMEPLVATDGHTIRIDPTTGEIGDTP